MFWDVSFCLNITLFLTIGFHNMFFFGYEASKTTKPAFFPRESPSTKKNYNLRKNISSLAMCEFVDSEMLETLLLIVLLLARLTSFRSCLNFEAICFVVISGGGRLHVIPIV